MILTSQLVQCFAFVLAAGAYGRVRLCPWNDTQTHVPPGSSIRFRIESRSYAVGTVRTAIWECYQTRDAAGNRLPFNPSGPMRNTRRDIADTINLLDATTPIDPSLSGFELWYEIGQVDETESPAYEVLQDMIPPPDLGDREYVLEVQNFEPAGVLPITLEVYVDIIEPVVTYSPKKGEAHVPVPMKQAVAWSGAREE